MTTAIPEGYMQDAKGALVPVSKIKPIDLERDDLVNSLINEAEELNSLIKKFKYNAFANIAAFIQLSAEQYQAKVGGKKGNVTLYSFDGQYKIQRAISDTITFDERLQAAKALIDDCIKDWSVGASDNIRVLVNDAFRVDKEGEINTGRVLGLRRLHITDEKWQKAMQAISDSVAVTSSKSYIRIYKRVGESDKYEPISLDIAAA